MKKLSLLLTFSLLASFAHADRIFGVYAGLGDWLSDYSGKAGEPAITLDELGVKEHANSFAYIAIEHPLPFVPDIKLVQTNITTSQTSTLKNSFTIGGTTYQTADTVQSSFDLSHRDITLYYQILDNWINFDVGTSIRKFNGYANTKSSTANKDLTINLTVPMAYGKLQFDLPFTDFSAGVETNITHYHDNSLSDYTAKISYLHDDFIGMELGYRKMAVKISDNDLKADITLKGPYGALIAHF